MPVENANFIHELEESFPSHEELVSEGDDHLRLIKAVIKATFPEITGSTSVTQGDLDSMSSHRAVLDLLLANSSVTGGELTTDVLRASALTKPGADLTEEKIPLANDEVQTSLSAEKWNGHRVRVETTDPTASDGEDGDFWFVRGTEVIE